jgi:hypothetical protein
VSSSWSLLFKPILHAGGTTTNCILDFGTWNQLTSHFTASWNAWVVCIEVKENSSCFLCIDCGAWMTISCHWGSFEVTTQCFLLEIRFSEPNWYKGKCKFALVRPISLYGLPDFHISFQVNKATWIGCNIILPKTSNNTNSWHINLTSWVSAPVSCLEANLQWHRKHCSKAIIQCVKEFLQH